ncbi:uncharacterized protein LOC108256972 [Ictalurus punctatus]|uniref:Uncharacterized protein LOC108256972 n=1 Tax=Ictalurus punctatus TaxID=7998 RepID=A0A2D0PUT3_ICTPU|nr:uncharacterized protein LOC108256972 [Ictalurus punctatus]
MASNSGFGFLLSSLEGLEGLDLNTRYQLSHLFADLNLLIDVLRTPAETSTFPPPLRYRLSPATIGVDVSTQTDFPSYVPSEHSSEYPEDDDDMARSDPESNFSQPYTPASPDYSDTLLSPTSSPGHTPYYKPFSPFCYASPTDYTPTSPTYS